MILATETGSGYDLCMELEKQMKRKHFLIPITAVVAAAILAGVGGWLALNNTADAQTTPGAPTNVMAVDGADPGQVVVSWDAVDGAAGYSVQWLNIDAAAVVFRADGHWYNAIQSVDVDASSSTLTVNGLSPGTNYGFQVGTKSGTSGDPELSGWNFLTPTGEDGRLDAYDAIRMQVAALAITSIASDLASVGSVATHAGMTQGSIREDRMAIHGHKAALDAQLTILKGRGFDERVDHIESLLNRLESNIDAIQQGRGALGAAFREEINSRSKLTADNSRELFPKTDASADLQFYNLATTLESGASEDDFLRYTHTYSLAANVTLGHTLLNIASLMQDPTFVARVQETYDSVAGRVDQDVEYLKDDTDTYLTEEILGLAVNVSNAGGSAGQPGYFDRLVLRLELVEKERALITNNTELQARLLAQIGELGKEIQGLPAAPIPTASTEDPGDPGITDDSVLFGQSAALSGSNSGLGRAMKLGIEAAFEEANSNGGVHGRMLELMTEDDGYEPDSAFAKTSKLINNDKVFGLIGSVGTPTSRAALPLAEAAGVPFVGAFTGAQLLREDDQTNILNYRASYHRETEEMVKQLADAGKTKVAVLYQKTRSALTDSPASATRWKPPMA